MKPRINGELFEKMAIEFLKEKGYIIHEINWRWKHKEIDIIAEKDNWLVIVEVKGRTNLNFGKPHEFINNDKKNFLVEAACAYIEQHQITLNVRFDAISICMNNQHFQIEHFENIFML